MVHHFYLAVFFSLMVSVVCADESGRPVPTAAGEVLDRAIESVERIKSLFLVHEKFAPVGSITDMDALARRDSEGRALLSFVRRWWDIRGLHRLDVIEWQPEGNRRLLGGEVYDHYLYTVDGEYYRGMGFISKRGKIRAQKELVGEEITPLFSSDTTCTG